MLSRPILTLALLCSSLLGACTPGVGVDVRQPVAVGQGQMLPLAQSLPAVAVAASGTATADLNGPFEPAPRLPSEELLPGFPLSGPGFRIAEQTQVVDYFGQFELRTDVGSLVADGSQVLKLRVRELDAVRALDDLSSGAVFVAAMARTAKRPVDALRQVAMDPVDTLSGLPTGIGRYLVRTALNIRDLALDLNDSARDALADDEEERDADGDDAKDSDIRMKSQKIATSAALRYIGYTKARREIARHVGADPYSTNPLLRERLDQLAWAAWSGAKLTSYGLGQIGGATAEAIDYAKDAYELVWELPPEDLKRRNLKVLEELGIDGKPARDLVNRTKAFTLTQQTEFIELLRLPIFADARIPLFERALQADREVHARFLIDALRMLRNADAPGASATVLGTSPALLRRDGSHVLAVPVDFLHWTEEMAAFAWRDDLIGRRNLLLVSGVLSPKALDAFSQAGWRVQERVEPHVVVPQVQSAQTAPLR
jgi:hypothetical protein